MINNVVLVGRMVADTELRHTGSGIAVASFRLAVNRPYKTNGEDEADFINCVIWRKAAENLSTYTRKGSLIGITGRIQTRNYTGNDGKKVYITEVVAESVQFLEPKKTNESSSNGNEDNHTPKNKNGSQAKNEGNKQNGKYSGFSEDPFDKNNDSIDISDDDLPF